MNVSFQNLTLVPLMGNQMYSQSVRREMEDVCNKVGRSKKEQAIQRDLWPIRHLYGLHLHHNLAGNNIVKP